MERATTMAGMRKMRGKWYARIRQWDGSRESESLVPLMTDSKTEAHQRLALVTRLERDLKTGVNFSFPWMNGNGETKVRFLTVEDAINEYLSERQFNGLARATIERDAQSLNNLKKVIGNSYPIHRMDSKQIEKFKRYYQDRLTNNGINLNLRHIKTFLRWCNRKGYIPFQVEIPMIKTPKERPRYFTESEWGEIVKNRDETRKRVIDPHFIRAFHFYRETGCRLAEPFYGKLDGNWLIIPAESTKQKTEKEVRLTDDLVAIWCEMKSRFDDRETKNDRDFINRYSKEFLKACRKAGIDHRFHDLRHTFGVRRWLQTGDIYLVKKEMGHASVTTTEKYAQFSLKRLAYDFPSLGGDGETGGKEGKSAIRDTEIRDTERVASTTS